MRKENVTRQFSFHIVFTSAALTLLLSSNAAYAIHKCILNGSITYSDMPCPANANVLPFTPSISPPNDPAAAKQRYLSDLQQLKKIEQQKEKEETQQKREALILINENKQARDKKFKCKDLDLKRKIAKQQRDKPQSKRKNKNNEQTEIRVQQAENNYQYFCKTE
ncbi:DUF4124 domain-containing protein [Solimicrobium silvestre]|uniref:DUF4124 domain-containing protein n=1 Tax=Solimicrobium silvestre TaxID=2099400 RepID=A0A2S9GTY7_9BURK|nr:DUF4124 domain-containing protein [Solimicrobium silvestre]PRC91192.1 hypothetical protein S2091_4087 [Solimicrobium silvestre]